MECVVDDVKVTVNDFDDMQEKEIKAYIKIIKDDTSRDLLALEISNENDGNVGLNYTLATQKFERIRRVTGYLVGSLDRWNDAKQSEERDRVKHSM